MLRSTGADSPKKEISINQFFITDEDFKRIANIRENHTKATLQKYFLELWELGSAQNNSISHESFLFYPFPNNIQFDVIDSFVQGNESIIRLTVSSQRDTKIISGGFDYNSNSPRHIIEIDNIGVHCKDKNLALKVVKGSTIRSKDWLIPMFINKENLSITCKHDLAILRDEAFGSESFRKANKKIEDDTTTSISKEQPPDLPIPPTSKFGIFKQMLAEQYPDRTDGIFRSPFGSSPTPNLPDGFQGNKWGDLIGDVKKTIKFKIVETHTNQTDTVLVVLEENRLVSYVFVNNMGLREVTVTYEAPGVYLKGPDVKADKLLLSLRDKFGKLPPENMHQKNELNWTEDELIWMDDKTAIIFSQIITERKEYNRLRVTFASRRVLNSVWSQKLNSFSDSYFPQFGRVPLLQKQLAWGMSFKDIKNLKDKDGKTIFEKQIYAEQTSKGNSKNKAFFEYEKGKSLLFNDEEILSACCVEFLPHTDAKAFEVVSKIKTILESHSRIKIQNGGIRFNV